MCKNVSNSIDPTKFASALRIFRPLKYNEVYDTVESNTGGRYIVAIPK